MDVRTRKVRVTLFYLSLIGLLIVVTSFYSYSLIQRQLFGSEGAGDIFLSWIPFLERERVEGVRVAVLRSDYTADYMAAQLGDNDSGVSPAQVRRNYAEISESWRRQIAGRNIDVSIVSDQDLERGLAEYNVLILPVAHCLSQAQVDAVKAFLRQRKGVILTHISGNRDESGQERSWSLTEDLTGGRVTFGTRHPDGEGRRLYLAGETPISGNLPLGVSLRIQDYDQPVKLRLREPRSSLAAVWGNGGGHGPGNLEDEVGMAYGHYLRGRFVWMGFTGQAVSPSRDMWAAFDQIMSNAVDWVAYRSVIGKGTWQETQSASTFGIVVQEDIAGAEGLAQSFAREDVPAGLFLAPEMVSIYRSSLLQLDERLPFAPKLRLSREEIEGEEGNNIPDMVSEGRREIETSLDRRVTGFSALSQPDLDVFDRLNRMNLNYFWLLSEFEPAPRIGPIMRNPLFGRIHPPILIHQTHRGDRELIDEERNTMAEDFTETLEADFRKMHRLGLLYAITLHSDWSGASRYQSALRAWLRNLHEKDTWIASPEELAGWWRLYENTQLRLVESPQRVTVMVSNEGREEVPLIRVLVFPGRMPESVRISAERIRTPIPDYEIQVDKGRIELRIEELRRRENRTYYLDFQF